MSRTFTKSLDADYDQDLSAGSSSGRQRTEVLTTLMSIWTALLNLKLSRTAQSHNRGSHNNSNGGRENHLNKGARNATAHLPYPSQPRHRILTSQSRIRMIHAVERLRSRQSSRKLGSRKENAYATGHQNTKHSRARNIHPPTSPKTLLLNKTENKSHATLPATVNN